MPTTARSLASTTASHPAARICSPPTPKNSSGSAGVGTAAAGCPAEQSSAGLRSSARRKASISSAPYISPDASPAEIRMRTEALYRAYLSDRTDAPGVKRITPSRFQLPPHPHGRQQGLHLPLNIPDSIRASLSHAVSPAPQSRLQALDS